MPDDSFEEEILDRELDDLDDSVIDLFTSGRGSLGERAAVRMARALTKGLPAARALEMARDIQQKYPGTAGDIHAMLLRMIDDLEEKNGKLTEENQELKSSQVEVQEALEAIRQRQEEQEIRLKKLMAPPLRVATFRCQHITPGGECKAMVSIGESMDLIVEVDIECDLGSLETGEKVLLVGNDNLLLSNLSSEVREGRLGTYVNDTGDGRLVVRVSAAEQRVLRRAAPLEGIDLKESDLIRYDGHFAYEKVEMDEPITDDSHLINDLSPEDVGGQNHVLGELLDLTLAFSSGEDLKEDFGLEDLSSCVLLSGPPGTGKTLCCRVVAAQLGKLLDCPVRFVLVKGSKINHPLFGQSEINVARIFDQAREAACQGIVTVIYFDELEALFRNRGVSSVNTISDRVESQLLQELDGFVKTPLCMILASCNRKDLLDPAVLDRFGELSLEVERPNLAGCREIFNIHLPSRLRFAGSDPAETRQLLIERGTSKICSAQTPLCHVMLDNEETITVHPELLVSGRGIMQVCKAARRKAMVRARKGIGPYGLTLEDLDEALCQSVEQMRGLLTMYNAKSHLTFIPDHRRVIEVKPAIEQEVTNKHVHVKSLRAA